MFAEYLKEETWQTVMPGVSVCNFALNRENGEIPVRIQPAHSEVFFCTGGGLSLKSFNGSSDTLAAREILLISNTDSINKVEMTAPLEGICLSVDQRAAGESFFELCQKFGKLDLSMKRVGQLMASSGGYRVISVTPWSRAAFYAIRHLPEEDRVKYCVMKTFEMLYLMCTQDPNGSVVQHDHSGSLNSVAVSMKNYMEEHMEEKLTITDLSRRFHLSRTACKSCFRTCFGQPIHSWLLDRRMERAAELLEHTRMPILQVAQSVGYTGVSQFNVAFRQRYGKSPREYRKMSASAGF